MRPLQFKGRSLADLPICRSADLPIVPVGVSITLVFFTIRGRKD
jgi:hypothetical protein